jgi:hypothetical protein
MNLIIGRSIVVTIMITGRRRRLAVSWLTMSSLAITRLTVFRFRSTTHHGGIGEARVVAWSVAGRAGSGGQLSIACTVLVAPVPFPEWGFARA